MKKLFVLTMMMVFGLTMTTTAQVKKKVVEMKEAVEKAVESKDGPKMKFESTVVDYGTIEQNADPYRSFAFTNEGNAPLVITSAKGSCGCTVPEYPKEPIMPGEDAEIKVRYDTKRIGKFTKSVTLTTNESDAKIVLRIKGDVQKKLEPESLPEAPKSIFSGGGK